MLVLAQATEKELAAQVQFLKAENEILRSKLKRNVIVSPADSCRLVKLGLPLGTAIGDLITIESNAAFPTLLLSFSVPPRGFHSGPMRCQDLTAAQLEALDTKLWPTANPLARLTK